MEQGVWGGRGREVSRGEKCVIKVKGMGISVEGNIIDLERH